MKYILQLNEEQIQDLKFACGLAIDRCCEEDEAEPFYELVELLNNCKGSEG